MQRWDVEALVQFASEKRQDEQFIQGNNSKKTKTVIGYVRDDVFKVDFVFFACLPYHTDSEGRRVDVGCTDQLNFYIYLLS